MHSVKLWDHLPQILQVLPPQVILLHTASSTPSASLSLRPINYSVFPEYFVLNRCNYAPSPDHAMRRYPQRMVYASPNANRVPIPDARRLDPYKFGQPHQRSWKKESRERQHSRHPISNRLLSPICITSLRLYRCCAIIMVAPVRACWVHTG